MGEISQTILPADPASHAWGHSVPLIRRREKFRPPSPYRNLIIVLLVSLFALLAMSTVIYYSDTAQRDAGYHVVCRGLGKVKRADCIWEKPQTSADWATCRADSGDQDIRIAACERLIKGGLGRTDVGWVHFYEGEAYGWKDQHEAAIAHLSETIRLRVNLVAARNDRGAEYMTQGNLDAALSDFDAATAADASYPLAYVNRAAVLRKKNQADRALVEVTQALRLDPQLFAGYRIRSLLYDDKGQWTEVVADSTRALEIDPKSALLLTRRGKAYRAMGKYDLARADLNAALRIDPRYEAALRELRIVRGAS
jgi:tetratricopeptide (TPR) repeat protein